MKNRSRSNPPSPSLVSIKKPPESEVPRSVRLAVANHQLLRGTSRRCNRCSTKKEPVRTIWSFKICKFPYATERADLVLRTTTNNNLCLEYFVILMFQYVRIFITSRFVLYNNKKSYYIQLFSSQWSPTVTTPYLTPPSTHI